ncbi:hypothetical protein EK21DRAFT_101323 [Setomelanomma holmii]|uniref:RNA ligase domain-containing protein n=1 Tax=Setomelanomma holmii TaxID=210430 RepID=A0A9P4H9B7_9PLEO|nr:hypothetical protein EK21DRAFT_101323 [Setomelanomma holmii]
MSALEPPSDSSSLILRSTSPSTTMASSTKSTLYPKITNHISEIVKALKELHRDPGRPGTDLTPGQISIVGTVKLHGTHADILVYGDDRIVFQSRNNVGLQTAKDNAGFANEMSRKTKALLRLRDIITARFALLKPDTSVDPNHPVLIAGEWIGQSIQKDVAVSKLSKRFWQRESDYGGIALPNHDIYNNSRAGVFSSILYPENIQRTIDDLEPLADQVAAHCPFAATFGHDGEGEGIVWKPALPPHNANPSLWFKTKGGRFKPTFISPPKQSPEGCEQKREAAAVVAKVWTSEQRLEQGLDYLKEECVERNMKSFGNFLKWVQGDIMVEEKGYIAEHKIDRQMLNIEIAKIAKVWYVRKIG